VAESAVDAEFKFARFRGFGVGGQWIVGFFGTSRASQECCQCEYS
jgi:hypothetical protein